MKATSFLCSKWYHQVKVGFMGEKSREANILLSTSHLAHG